MFQRVLAALAARFSFLAMLPLSVAANRSEANSGTSKGVRKMMRLGLFFLAPCVWGGTCPSGANYVNPSNATGSLVTLSSLGITNCYYIAANGSD